MPAMPSVRAYAWKVYAVHHHQTHDLEVLEGLSLVVGEGNPTFLFDILSLTWSRSLSNGGTEDRHELPIT